MSTNAPLSGQATYKRITDDPEFHALSLPEQSEALSGVDNDFKGLDTAQQVEVLKGIGDSWKRKQGPTVSEGFGNLARAAGSGLNNVIQGIPHVLPGIAQQVGNAWNTESQSFNQDEPKGYGMESQLGAFGSGAVQGLRGLGQGILSLPADIGNAYQGKKIYQPAVTLPQLPQPAQNLMTRYPLSAGLGSFALPVGLPARVGATGNLGRLALGAAEGAALGGISENPDGLQGRLGAAVQGAALSTVLGAAGRMISKEKPVPQPTLQGRVIEEHGPVDPVMKETPEQVNQRFLSDATTAIINLRQAGKTVEAKNLLKALPSEIQSQIYSEIDAFNKKNEGRKAVEAKRIQQAVEKLGPDAQGLKAAQQLRTAIQERYKQTPEQKAAKSQADRIQLDSIKTENRQKPIQARIQLEKARQETLAARSVREKARLEYQSAKQLLDVVKKGGNAKAVNNAKRLIFSAQEKLTQANAELNTKTKAEKAARPQPELKPANQPQAPIKGQVRITGAGRNEKVIDEAIRHGKAIEAVHHADKAGTRSDSTFEDKFDLPVEKGTIKRLVDPVSKRVITNPKNGKPLDIKTRAAQQLLQEGKAELRDAPFVRVINENGQFSMRYMEDLKGPVKISDKEHPYSVVMNENGKYDVVKNGELVTQRAGELTRHSELAPQAEKLKSLGKDPTSTSVREILEASEQITEKQFMDILRDLPQEKINELGKKVDC